MRSVQALFTPTPDGMPGNDDLGSLTGWYVWAALGLQPNTYGSPVLTVGSPLFGRRPSRCPAAGSWSRRPGRR
jgi:putative alpha-1,2-mannosidase